MIGKVPMPALQRRSKEVNSLDTRTTISTVSMWNYEARKGLKDLEEKKKQKEKNNQETKIDISDLMKAEKLSIRDEDREK